MITSYTDVDKAEIKRIKYARKLEEEDYLTPYPHSLTKLFKLPQLAPALLKAPIGSFWKAVETVQAGKKEGLKFTDDFFAPVIEDLRDRLAEYGKELHPDLGKNGYSDTFTHLEVFFENANYCKQFFTDGVPSDEYIVNVLSPHPCSRKLSTDSAKTLLFKLLKIEKKDLYDQGLKTTKVVELLANKISPQCYQELLSNLNSSTSRLLPLNNYLNNLDNRAYRDYVYRKKKEDGEKSLTLQSLKEFIIARQYKLFLKTYRQYDIEFIKELLAQDFETLAPLDSRYEEIFMAYQYLEYIVVGNEKYSALEESDLKRLASFVSYLIANFTAHKNDPARGAHQGPAWPSELFRILVQNRYLTFKEIN